MPDSEGELEIGLHRQEHPVRLETEDGGLMGLRAMRSGSFGVILGLLLAAHLLLASADEHSHKVGFFTLRYIKPLKIDVCTHQHPGGNLLIAVGLV